MTSQRQQQLEALAHASPLEITNKLVEFELYDKNSSQQIIDEVYAEFKSGENLTDTVLKPVFLSIIDGLLAATSGGRTASKKGLTASRVFHECEQFAYEYTLGSASTVQENGSSSKAETTTVNSKMTQEFKRATYEDKKAMEDYKKDNVLGKKMLEDEYTQKKNLYLKRDNQPLHYNDEKHLKQAEPDHIVPLKTVHENLRRNYALDDEDIKRIANIRENFAVTSAALNRKKQDKSNLVFVEKMEQNGTPLDKDTAVNMIRKQKQAERAIDNETNKTVANNLLGRGTDKQKTKEIRIKAVNNAMGQATEQSKDQAVGELILYMLKPLYYEMKDILRHGMTDGVGASSTLEAMSIRFGRVKRCLLENALVLLSDNLLAFVKNIISSLVEGIISLFVGIFKQVLKLLKEGFKIFVQSARIVFGKEGQSMAPAQKGDAIVKLIGGSVIALSGIGIEFLLNKIGIGEPWSVIISTMFGGVASALFMLLLDKIDLFSTKAEMRKQRIEEIFDERIQEIRTMSESLNLVAIETLRKQHQEFEVVKDEISAGLESKDLNRVNQGMYRLAGFFKVKLPYQNTDEFIAYFDATPGFEF